jgi:hypothetical protein
MRFKGRHTFSALGNLFSSNKPAEVGIPLIQAKTKCTEISANPGVMVSKSHSRPSLSCSSIATCQVPRVNDSSLGVHDSRPTKCVESSEMDFSATPAKAAGLIFLPMSFGECQFDGDSVQRRLVPTSPLSLRNGAGSLSHEIKPVALLNKAFST